MGYYTYGGYKPDITTFSILGDSFSSFAGYDENTGSWYPSGDVLAVEDMWWHKFAADEKAVLTQNNSKSGAAISYVNGTTTAFITRMSNLKNAELILIEGATNDKNLSAPMGEYKYADWVEEDFSNFRPACAYMIDYLQKHCAGSKIVFMLSSTLGEDIIGSVDTICEHYGVPVFHFTVDRDSNNAFHPSKLGQQQLKDQLVEFLKGVR